MSEIDWMTLGLAAQADANYARAKKAEGELSETSGNLEAARRKLREREQYISILERKLAEAEHELRHYKSRDAGFIAQLKELIQEIKSCPSQDHHTLIEEGENGHKPMHDVFDKVYYESWDDLGKKT